MRDSVASNNSSFGFSAGALSGWVSDLTIENCLANGNSVGILADNTWSGSVTVRVSNASVSGNTTGIKQTPGTTFYSRGNSTVHGNSLNNAVGAITLISGS